MKDPFRGSRLKIKRANKHLADFHDMFVTFSKSDCYAATVEEDSEKRTHSLHFVVDVQGLNAIRDEATVIIGDILHNLRSALDHLWYQVILACDGKPSPWTSFPIRDTREELKAPIDGALEKEQITERVAKFVT